MSRTASKNFGKHSRKVSMLINTTRQEEREIDRIFDGLKNRGPVESEVRSLVTIIERLDAVITDKDAMIKRLQQGHKVL